MSVLAIISTMIVYDVCKEITLAYIRGRALQKEFARINTELTHGQLLNEEDEGTQWH